MRILAIDPGSKRIGLAISDPTGTIASPLAVIDHIARAQDALRISKLASQHGAGLIIVGQSLDELGRPTLEGRRAARLAAEIRTQSGLPVELWDEESSTQAARSARLALGVARRRRRGHQDDLAAAIILQSYLEAHRSDQL